MRMLTELEKQILKHNCIEHQAIDEYCEACKGGCLGCQTKWLRELGWGNEDLPKKPIPLFGNNIIKKCTMFKIPAIQGCYGERWFIVENENENIRRFFTLISLWPTSVFSSKDNDFIHGYELPVGVTLNIDNPLVEHIFNKLNIEIINREE